MIYSMVISNVLRNRTHEAKKKNSPIPCGSLLQTSFVLSTLWCSTGQLSSMVYLKQQHSA